MPRIIPVSDAVRIAREVASGLPEEKDNVLVYLTQSCPRINMDGNYYFNLDDLKGFLRNYKKWLEKKDASLLKRKQGMKAPEVDIIEFCESDEYMGMGGSLWPAVAEALWNIWHDTSEPNVIEVVLTGATNTGKSFILEMCVCYMAYRMLNLHDPQAELNLARGTSLYFALQSGTRDRAKDILFKPIMQRMSESTLFTKRYPFRKDVKIELQFQNNIILKPFSGSDDAVLGLTVVGFGITELNRMAYIERSKRNRFKKTLEEQAYDQAMEIYKTGVRRMAARTMQLGKLWGKVILDAASEHEDDFTARKLKEWKAQEPGKRKIFIYNKAQWEVAPTGRYSGEETFLVEVGTSRRRSRILTDRSQAADEDRVKEVPMDLKFWFDQDVEGALREFGGITTSTEMPAIPYTDRIQKGFEDFKAITGGRQLFLVNEAALQDYRGATLETDDWEALIDHDYIREHFLDPTIHIACHVDPALNHCNAGIAIGHINGWKLQPAVKRWNAVKRKYEEKHAHRSPMLMIDGLLAVTAPYGEEIDLTMIQNLMIYLKQVMNLKTVTIDSYQSSQMKQEWIKARLTTGTVSVDDSLEPYTRMKNAYKEERLITPHIPLYEDEVVNLQFTGGKYDHLKGKSKDLSDAVAGCVFLLETHVASSAQTTSHSDRVRRGRRLYKYAARRASHQARLRSQQ